MEPTLIKNNKIFNNQKKVIVTLIIFLVCLFIGTSYSILTSTDETEEVITFQAGDLNLEVKTNTDTSVNFPDELPKSEEEVEKPVILNIKNTGSLTICEYRLKLVADTSPDSPASDLEVNYIRYAISKDSGVTYNESKLLSETDNQIFIGFNLKPTETKTIYVKVWLDETTLDNEEVLNKHFYGKIDAELLQRCEATATEHLKSTIGETGGIIGVTNDSQKVTADTKNIREYRYSGLGVNNYVTFNNELWRILGVFKDENGNELVKIVRNEVLKRDVFPETYTANETSFKIHYGREEYVRWNQKLDDSCSNDWVKGGLKYWLNSEGTTDGYSKTLTSEAQGMIEETKWYLGNVYWDGTVVQSYEDERKSAKCSNEVTSNSLKSNCYIWPNNEATWIGKIGLMYPSDFGFSIDSSHWSTKKLYTDHQTFIDSSWLYKEANHMFYEWFITPSFDVPETATIWGIDGYVGYSHAVNGGTVRPSLYLKSDTVITSGKGSSTDPYILQY